MILALNSGSSSVRAAWFAADADLRPIGSAVVEGVGSAAARFRVRHADGDTVRDESMDSMDYETAFDLLLTHIETWESAAPLAAVGHRVVHGGSDFDHARRVDEQLLSQLTALTALAPVHLPSNLSGIAEATIRWPDIPQVACFDTAFHRTLPPTSRMIGVPRDWQRLGIRRYGFHGLSYESVVDNLTVNEGASAAAGRIIVAHLGSGASMAALHRGESVDTTMGFSTAGGLVMSTRCGDLDPGVLLYALNEGLVDATNAQALLYEKSGLLGTSNVSGDMQVLLASQHLPDVRDAIALFCHSARKHLAALTAVLGGLDRLVFTGGIGENSPEIRQRICTGLSYLGITLNAEQNEREHRTISLPDTPVVVNVIHSNEELIIARHTYRHAVQPPAPVAAECGDGM